MQLAELAELALSEPQECLSDGLWTSRCPVVLPLSPVPSQNAAPDRADTSSQLFPHHEFGFCATQNGDVYFYGGAAADRKDVLYRYSTTENTITPLQCWGASPGDRQAHFLAVVGNIIALHGGWKNGPTDPNLFLLNLASREWSRIATAGQTPGKRYHHTMTASGATIYLFGGWEGTSWDGLWAFDLNTLRTEPAWELIEPLSQERPSPGAECTLASYRNQLILFGGWSGYRRNDVWSFDLENRNWSKLQCRGDIPPPRFGHKAAVLDSDVMYIVGGFGEGDVRLNDVFVLKIPERQWFKLENTDSTPLPRRRHASVCIGAKLFIFGGQFNEGASERDPIHVLDIIHQYSDPTYARMLGSSTKGAEAKVLRAQVGELALLVHASHPNVIPLFGAYLSSETRPRICIVSPWMENGDLTNYLEKFPNTPIIPLMYDLAAAWNFYMI